MAKSVQVRFKDIEIILSVWKCSIALNCFEIASKIVLNAESPN